MQAFSLPSCPGEPMKSLGLKEAFLPPIKFSFVNAVQLILVCIKANIILTYLTYYTVTFEI